MKKFMGKIYVMIASLVLFVFASVSLICVLAQPLFYAGEYYSKIEYESPEGDKYVDEIWLNVNADNTIESRRVAKNETTGEVHEETLTYWYYLNGKELFQVSETEDLTKEEYEDAVKEIKEMTEEEYNEYRDEMAYILSFKALYLSNKSSMRESSYAQYSHFTYKNDAKIPTVIVLSVVETLLLAVAIISVVCFISNKKGNVAPAVAETPAEETKEETTEEVVAE